MIQQKALFILMEKMLKSYSVRKLRENISMVMQDVFSFSNTIEDNIAFW